MPKPNWSVGRSVGRSSFLPSGGYALATAVVVILLVLGVGACASAYYGDDPVRITVNDKESVAKGNNEGHEYRVYTNKGTFVMKDSIIKGRFATGDDYGKLQKGKTYDCKAFGFRVPLFSSFKNLHGCHESE